VEEIGRVFETNLVWNFMIVRQAAIAICGKRIYDDQKSILFFFFIPFIQCFSGFLTAGVL